MYIIGLLFLIYILYTIFFSLLYLKGKNEKKKEYENIDQINSVFILILIKFFSRF